MKLSELAALTGARLEGTNDDSEITGAAGLNEASEGHVTFAGFVEPGGSCYFDVVVGPFKAGAGQRGEF